MDFTNVFTSNYKRYVITGTDCRPATGNTHLYLQYIDASGLNSSSSHWTAWVGYSGGYAGTSFNDDETISSTPSDSIAKTAPTISMIESSAPTSCKCTLSSEVP